MTESHLYFTPEEQKDCQSDRLIFVGHYIDLSNGEVLNARETCYKSNKARGQEYSQNRPSL